MRLLHTGDLHLGHRLYDYDRQEEQQQMLSRLVEIASLTVPDVMVMCGDLFHTSHPSTQVQRMFADFILALRESVPGIKIVAIAGNHDSGNGVEIFRTPWSRLGVEMVGMLDRMNPDSHIISIPDKGWVVALPYIHTRNLPGDFMENLYARLEKLNVDNLPVVLAAHTTIAGCDATGHNDATPVSVGGIDTMTLEELGTGYDYIALGHIHRPQNLYRDKKLIAHYSGTPLPLNFDETFPHTVTLVEIDGKGLVNIEEVEIIPNRPLVTIPAKGFYPLEAALLRLAELPDDLDCYVRLNVEVDGFLPGDAMRRGKDICESKNCKFCLINTHRKGDESADEARVLSVNEFREIEPLEIACRYAKDIGMTFDGRLKELFMDATRQLREEEDEI